MKSQKQIRVDSLVSSKYDKYQRSLDLQYEELDVQTTKLLFQDSKWEEVRKLYLVLTQLGDLQFSIVIRCHMPNLELLDIGSNRITQKAMEQFSTIKWHKLEELFLGNNPIGDKGFNYFVKTQFQLLKQLFIGTAQLTYKSMIYFRQMKNNSFESLRVLSLAKNYIGSKGAKLLWMVKLPSITDLYLAECNIGNDGVRHLTKAYFPQLSVFYFGFNYIKKDGFNDVFMNNWKLLKFADLQTKQIDALSLFSLTQVNWRKFKFNLMYLYGVLNYHLKYFVERALGKKFEDPLIFLEEELIYQNVNQ